MTEVTTLPLPGDSAESAEAVTRPVLTALPPDSGELCDGHASGSTLALFNVLLASGKMLHLCGHCSRPFAPAGEHPEWPEWINPNRLRGSAN